jgi:hypothetical protein
MVELEPQLVDFGRVEVGRWTSTVPVRIVNHSDRQVPFEVLSGEDDVSPLQLDLPDPPWVLPAGGTVIVFSVEHIAEPPQGTQVGSTRLPVRTLAKTVVRRAPLGADKPEEPIATIDLELEHPIKHWGLRRSKAAELLLSHLRGPNPSAQVTGSQAASRWENRIIVIAGITPP